MRGRSGDEWWIDKYIAFFLHPKKYSAEGKLHFSKLTSMTPSYVGMFFTSSLATSFTCKSLWSN